jgi:hypothetical protein
MRMEGVSRVKIEEDFLYLTLQKPGRHIYQDSYGKWNEIRGWRALYLGV